MSYIVVMRNPSANSGKLIALTEEDDSVAEFETREAARDAAAECPACHAWGFEVLEVELI